MAGTVYLRTNRFEVKLEAITFKTRDFEILCSMDFLFPNGKVWTRPPVVGLDVMNHPRDPNILLLLLCFGIGCLILRFNAGEPLPDSIRTFLSDKRMHVVGFGIPEKRDLFPFEELGLTKSRVDVGYVASRVLKDTKYMKCELAELARRVLGIKKMIGLTEASSFERHEQVKCAICQLFITSIIGIKLLGGNNSGFGKKKKKKSSSEKSSKVKGMSFLKNLNSLQFLSEAWLKLPIGKKKRNMGVEKIDDCTGDDDDDDGDNVAKPKHEKSLYLTQDDKAPNDDTDTTKKHCSSSPVEAKEEDDKGIANLVIIEETIKLDLLSDSVEDCDDEEKECEKERGKDKDDEEKNNSCKQQISCHITIPNKKPLKGILKCPSSNNMLRTDSFASLPDSPPPTPNDQSGVLRGSLKRANSKGCNVSFKCMP